MISDILISTLALLGSARGAPEEIPRMTPQQHDHLFFNHNMEELITKLATSPGVPAPLIQTLQMVHSNSVNDLHNQLINGARTEDTYNLLMEMLGAGFGYPGLHNSHTELLAKEFGMEANLPSLLATEGVPLSYYIPRRSGEARWWRQYKMAKFLGGTPESAVLNLEPRASPLDPGFPMMIDQANKLVLRDPVELEYILPSMACPKFLGKYFHVFTSRVTLQNALPGTPNKILGRTYYAPVLVLDWAKDILMGPGGIETGFPRLKILSVHMEQMEDNLNNEERLFKGSQFIRDAALVDIENPGHLETHLATEIGNAKAVAEFMRAVRYLSALPHILAKTPQLLFAKRDVALSEQYYQACGRMGVPGEIMTAHGYDPAYRTYRIAYGGKDKPTKVITFLDPGFHFKTGNGLGAGRRNQYDNIWEGYERLWSLEMEERYRQDGHYNFLTPESYFLPENKQHAKRRCLFVRRWTEIERGMLERKREEFNEKRRNKRRQTRGMGMRVRPRGLV